MSFPRYPEYKDSGVEWLGDVPVHWSVQPAKYGISTKSGGQATKNTVSSEPGDDLFPAFSASGQDIWMEEYEFEGPAVVLSAVGARCGKTFKASGRWGVVANTHCLFPRAGFSRDFLWYLTNRESWWERGGTAQPFVKVSETLARKWVFPPMGEQEAIATFLDRETTKIDTLVAEQEKLIALLQEKRQAVISHAVTKGLDPNVPMKDSGVEWLGEVPAHWEVTTLKRHWTAADCKHVTAEFVEDGIPLASIREVQSRWVELEEAKRTTEYFYQLLIEGGRDPRPGDLIFSRNATVGEVAQVHPDHQPFAMGQDVVLLRRIAKAASPDFLQLVIRSSVVTQQLALCMVGSTFKRINVEEIRSLVIAFPPPDEQAKIANHLLAQAEMFDQLIGEALLSSELLQERRTALISAAVTGQIDVRGLAGGANAPDSIAESAYPAGA